MKPSRDNSNLGSYSAFTKESGTKKQSLQKLGTWKSTSQTPRDNNIQVMRRNPLEDIFSQNKANSYFSQNNFSGYINRKGLEDLFPQKKSQPIPNSNFSGYLKRTFDDETSKPQRNNSTAVGINKRGLDDVILEKERRRCSPFERKLKTSQTYIDIAFTKHQQPKKQDPYFFESLKPQNNRNPLIEFNFEKEQPPRIQNDKYLPLKDNRKEVIKGLDKELDIGLRVQSDIIDRKAIYPKNNNWLKATDPQKYPTQRNIFQAVPNMEINRMSSRLGEYTCGEVQTLSSNFYSYINELNSLYQTVNRLISQASRRRQF